MSIYKLSALNFCFLLCCFSFCHNKFPGSRFQVFFFYFCKREMQTALKSCPKTKKQKTKEKKKKQSKGYLCVWGTRYTDTNTALYLYDNIFTHIIPIFALFFYFIYLRSYVVSTSPYHLLFP